MTTRPEPDPDQEERTKQIDGDASPVASGPRLWLTVHRQGETEAYPLPRATPLTLGRTDAADVVVADDSLSRVHACFTNLGDEVRIEDRGSTNGTFVGGRRVQTALVKPGDEVFLGKVAVSVHARGGRSAAVAAVPATGAAEPQALVVSPEMRALYASLDQVALTRAPVLILGETGVGKELVARAIHDRSSRAGKPFESINCGVLTPTLVESALFGHEQGAFTGAERAKRGLFEQANHGSLFLDEIADLPAAIQASLLRVLDTQKIRPVGSGSESTVDVRIIAATNRNLEQMCNEGQFRKDLFFRLNTIVLRIPPLRARPQEIVPLSERFLAAAVKEAKLGPKCFGAGALQVLQAHHWPGNVRELRNVVERAALFSQADEIGSADLLFADIAGAGISPAADVPAVALASAVSQDAGGDGALRERVRAYEVELIVRALERTGWKQADAARLLKLPARTLGHKIQIYGITKGAAPKRS